MVVFVLLKKGIREVKIGVMPVVLIIIICVIAINFADQVKSIRKDLNVIKTVLIVKNIMPKELNTKEKGN